MSRHLTCSPVTYPVSLMTSRFLNVRLPRNSCNESKYLIIIALLSIPTSQFIVPKRVVTANLGWSRVQTINSNTCKANIKRPRTRLPMSILRLKLWVTNLLRVPTGFFVSLDLAKTQITIQPRPRESNIKFNSECLSNIRLVYLPKSTNESSLNLLSRQ